MKLLSKLLLFIISLNLQAQVGLHPDILGNPAFQQTKCFDRYTTEAPFSVSDASGMGWKTYENFRSKDNHRKKENIIPRRSIVKIKKGSEDFANSPNSYVPVEVLGVAQSDFHDENLKNSRLSVASSKKQKLKKVNVGKKGFIYSKSLKKADEYTYILKEDSPLLADNGLTEMGVVAIRPDTNSDGEFLVNECCTHDNTTRDFIAPVCKKKYSFRLVYSDDSYGKSIDLDVNACNIADSLMPFKNKEVVAMMNFISSSSNSGTNFNLDKVEMIDDQGLTKIPLDYDSYDGQGMSGPFGSYHYNTDDKGASDVYSKPLTGCAFMKVLEQQQKSCKGAGCQVQFGNLFHLKTWGTHQFHGSGKCIDIRPMKTDDSKTSLTYKSSNYDREKTLNFIKLLKKAGGSPIVFDDRKVTNEFPDRSDIRPTSDGSHANHIHVCFDPKSTKVKKTCYQGL
jgi:hypothetical protein